MEGADDPLHELVAFLVARTPPIQIPWLTVAMETTFNEVPCTFVTASSTLIIGLFVLLVKVHAQCQPNTIGDLKTISSAKLSFVHRAARRKLLPPVTQETMIQIEILVCL